MGGWAGRRVGGRAGGPLLSAVDLSPPRARPTRAAWHADAGQAGRARGGGGPVVGVGAGVLGRGCGRGAWALERVGEWALRERALARRGGGGAGGAGDARRWGRAHGEWGRMQGRERGAGPGTGSGAGARERSSVAGTNGGAHGVGHCGLRFNIDS